ncbi:MAG: hypothetical protein HC904_11855 [Blastochloris sp.]|nr:hypothetical protein [Blastochloris sp.]
MHELFSGYSNVQRNISEISLQFEGACITLMMMKEKDSPYYLATMAENVEALSAASEETRLWAVTDMVPSPKRLSKITTKLRPTLHLVWGRFLARLRDCLELSLGADSAAIVLTRSLEHFSIQSSEPLPKEQWLAFVAEVGNQIPNADARARFYKLYAEMDSASAAQN